MEMPERRYAKFPRFCWPDGPNGRRPAPGNRGRQRATGEDHAVEGELIVLGFVQLAFFGIGSRFLVSGPAPA